MICTICDTNMLNVCRLDDFGYAMEASWCPNCGSLVRVTFTSDNIKYGGSPQWTVPNVSKAEKHRGR